jgi:MFS superfamily sulfate permease-like transporter
MLIEAGPASIARRLLPVLGWLPAYQRTWLLPDVLAGLAVWAVMVPEGMAYAGIVGVPAIMGLYTIVPPLLTSTLAILIGAFFLVFGVLRMGWMAAFIPTPVMRGFIEGLVCVTIIGQVPHLLGISGASGNFFTKLWFVLQHLRDAPLAPALTGLLSLIAMILLRLCLPFT